VPRVSEAVETLKRAAKRSRAGAVLGRIGVERTRDVRRMLGRRDGPMGATHQRFDVDGSVAYVNAVFDDYLRYGSLTPADLEGARVLELGPGDNLGVALRFVAAGVARMVAADRFIPFRDLEQERRVYESLIAGLSQEERERVASVLAGSGTSFDSIPLEFHQELPIEDAPGVLGEEEFDLIVSRAVLEHVHDLDTAFESMKRLLVPGGRMIHKVDLEDHGLFTGGGQNPLTFLTIPDRVYRWMGEESAGLPNRRMMGWYESKLAELGFEAEFLVTVLAGSDVEVDPHVPQEQAVAGAPTDLVSEVRPKLLERYRSLPDEELIVAGFMVIARKPMQTE
jgi:SAM-dependent methyltransferase